MTPTKKNWLWANLWFLAIAGTLIAVLVSKHDIIAANSVKRSAPKVEPLAVKDLAVKRGEMREGYGLDTLLAATPAQIAKGKELYGSNCAGCHGMDGKGNPALGSRNFTQLSGWLNPTHFAGIYKTLQEGVGKMPAFATLSVPDRANIIHYIQTLAAYPKVAASDKATLESEYKLSQPAKTPNQIPVALAIEKVVEDAQKPSSSAVVDSVSK